MLKTFKILGLLAISALLLTGCNSTMEGAESDIKDGASMVESDVKDGGSMLESGAESIVSGVESKMN